MELKLSLDLYGFKKMFDDVLEWATEKQKSDIFEYFEELSYCDVSLDEMTVRDSIRYEMNVDTHDDVINMYDCIKEHMNDYECDLHEALSYYTTILSYSDDEVVYIPF